MIQIKKKNRREKILSLIWSVNRFKLTRKEETELREYLKREKDSKATPILNILSIFTIQKPKTITRKRVIVWRKRVGTGWKRIVIGVLLLQLKDLLKRVIKFTTTMGKEPIVSLWCGMVSVQKRTSMTHFLFEFNSKTQINGLYINYLNIWYLLVGFNNNSMVRSS